MRIIATIAGVAVATVAATALPSSTLDRRHLSYETIAGYSPGSEVTDHCTIDLDQAAIEFQLAIKTSESFDNARRIYYEGGHSKSFARIMLSSSLPFDVRKWTEIAGYDETGNEVLGRAYEDRLAGATEIRVQYATPDAPDADRCHVGGLTETSTGGCLVEQGDVRIAGNDEKIAYVYDPLSDNNNARTIAGFSIDAVLLECWNCPQFEFWNAEYDYYGILFDYYNYYGSVSYADEWIKSALGGGQTRFTNGNADFSTLGFDGKAAFVGRATVLMNVFMETVLRFENALNDCQTGCEGCNEDAVHSWDAGVCTYVGSLSKGSYRASDQEGDVGDRGGKLLHSLADEMCSNFATCYGQGGDQPNGESRVNRKIKDLFASGNYELSNGNCLAVPAIINDITALMYVPLVQGTLLYAHKMMKPSGMAEEDNAAGAAFAAAVLPRVHAADPSYASYIHDVMKVGTTGGSSMRVKATFENAYEQLGIACADVGGIWDYENDDYYPDLGPCVDPASKESEPQDRMSCMTLGSDSKHSFCTNEGECVDIVEDNEQHKGCICKGEFEGPHCEFVVAVVGTAPTNRPATNVTLNPNDPASLSPSSNKTSSLPPQALVSPAPSPPPLPTKEEIFMPTGHLDGEVLDLTPTNRTMGIPVDGYRFEGASVCACEGRCGGGTSSVDWVGGGITAARCGAYCDRYRNNKKFGDALKGFSLELDPYNINMHHCTCLFDFGHHSDNAFVDEFDDSVNLDDDEGEDARYYDREDAREAARNLDEDVWFEISEDGVVCHDGMPVCPEDPEDPNVNDFFCKGGTAECDTTLYPYCACDAGRTLCQHGINVCDGGAVVGFDEHDDVEDDAVCIVFRVDSGIVTCNFGWGESRNISFVPSYEASCYKVNNDNLDEEYEDDDFANEGPDHEANPGSFRPDDLSEYSIKFQECHVDNYEKRLVTFRLCQDSICESCHNDDFSNEYTVDLTTYLESVIEYKMDRQEQMCYACNECVAEVKDAEQIEWCNLVDTSTCYEECQLIENMEESGYLDAAEFIECQMIYDGSGSSGEVPLYAGPVCSGDGSHIKIGVFAYKDCTGYDETKDIEVYLMNEEGNDMKLSHHLLKQTYGGDCTVTCLRGMENEDNTFGNRVLEQDEITEACQDLMDQWTAITSSEDWVITPPPSPPSPPTTSANIGQGGADTSEIFDESEVNQNGNDQNGNDEEEEAILSPESSSSMNVTTKPTVEPSTTQSQNATTSSAKTTTPPSSSPTERGTELSSYNPTESEIVFTEDMDSSSSCERIVSCFCFATLAVLALL